MKKVESVLNGSPECGKTIARATFPHSFLRLLSLSLPEKFPMKSWDECINASYPSVEKLFKRLMRNFLTKIKNWRKK